VVRDVEYRQGAAGGAVDLGPKTTSVQDWSQALHDHVRAGGFESEVEHWTAATAIVVAARATAGMPALPAPAGEDDATPGRVRAGPGRQFRAVARRAGGLPDRGERHPAHRAGLALARHAGGRGARIDLEGHGREDILDGVDLSRTVGWFTTLYPVALTVDDEPDWRSRCRRSAGGCGPYPPTGSASGRWPT
jgi:hypothetical protein